MGPPEVGLGRGKAGNEDNWASSTINHGYLPATVAR